MLPPSRASPICNRFNRFRKHGIPDRITFALWSKVGSIACTIKTTSITIEPPCLFKWQIDASAYGCSFSYTSVDIVLIPLFWRIIVTI